MSQCIAPTKKGPRCTRKAKKGNYCNQHYEMLSNQMNDKSNQRFDFDLSYGTNKIKPHLNALEFHVGFTGFKPIGENSPLPKCLPNPMNILGKIPRDLAFQIIHKLESSELLNLALTCKSYKELCFHPTLWMQKCKKDFRIKVGSPNRAHEAYRGKFKNIIKKVFSRLTADHLEIASEYAIYHEYRGDFQKIFGSSAAKNTSPYSKLVLNIDANTVNPYQICLIVLIHQLHNYYDDYIYSPLNRENCCIAQYLMDFKGRPFYCPDDIVPCYSCGPQSPTLEIVQYLITRPGKKK